MRVLVLRGLLGSIVMTIAGLIYGRMLPHSWPTRLPIIGDLHRSPHQLLFGLSLAFIGLALMAWAWWDLRSAALERPDGVRLIQKTALLWCLPMFLAPPLFSGDGWSYVGNGYLAGHGLSPYKVTPMALPHNLLLLVNARWRDVTTPYGPLPIAWGGFWSHLFSDPWVLLACYRLLSLLSLLVILWAVPKLAERTGRNPISASALILTSPFLLAHGIGGLHNDLTVIAFGMAALVLTKPDRWLVGAALAGCSAAVKAPGGLIAVGVVLLSLGPGAQLLDRIKRSVAVAAVAAFVLVACGWVTGLGSGWIQGLSVPDLVHTSLALSTGIGVGIQQLFNQIGVGSPSFVRSLHLLAVFKYAAEALLVAVTAWMLLRRRVQSANDAVAAAGIVMFSAVALSPAVHIWYLLWFLPILACVRMPKAFNAAILAELIAVGATSFVDGAQHFFWLNQAQTFSVLLAPVIAWFVVQHREDRMPHAPLASMPEELV